jgi:hypothetical protein
VVTEEYFVQTFSRFGQVLDAAVKRFEINEVRMQAYALVCLFSRERIVYVPRRCIVVRVGLCTMSPIVISSLSRS